MPFRLRITYVFRPTIESVIGLVVTLRMYCYNTTHLFLSLIFLFIFHQSANAKTDSLYQVWQNLNESDSIRIVAYTDYIAKKFVTKKLDSTQVAADKLKAFSEEKGQRFGVANAMRLLGASKFFHYEHVAAINLLNESLELSEALTYTYGQAKALQLLGMVYKRQSKEVKSMGYYEKSLVLYEELGDLDDYAGALMEVGSIHKIAENYDKALAYFQRAYELYQQIGREDKFAGALAQIASIYRRKEEFKKALEINEQALKLRREGGPPLSVASSLNNMGNIYEDIGDFEEALAHHFQALAIREKVGKEDKIASSYRNIGETYSDLNDYKKGVAYCKKGLDLYEKTDVTSRQLACSHCLYQAHKKLGDATKTLKYLEKMFELRAKVGHERSVKQLQRMEFDKQIMADSMARVEEKMQIALLHQKAIEAKEKTRNRAISAFVLSLLGALGFYFRWRLQRKANIEIKREYDRAEGLLLNILPAEIAEELKDTGEASARDFNQVSVVFTDFKGFTQISEELSAKELVEELNVCFKAFDSIITKHGLEKIKTIGDAYMAAGGLPAPDENATKKTVMAALEMSDFIIKRRERLSAEGRLAFQMRTGIHTGPVVAGIVGVKKFQYDIWGDTVNTASRMESNGAVGRVNVSEYVYDILQEDEDFNFEERGKIEVKGKGEIAMYFIEKKSSVLLSTSLAEG